MTKLIKLNNDIETYQEFIRIIKDKEILVYEDVQGSRVFVKWDRDKFIIKPKSVKNDPLNFVDLAVQKFYNQAFSYFHTLPSYVTNLLNPNWWFCFEYFPPFDVQPGNIEYSKVPKNGLILTCIIKGNKYVYNYGEIKEYANLFDCDVLPVIYIGKFNEKQLEIISLFLNTSENDLDYVFGESNFAKFFYDILNPQTENSFLMDTGDFNDNLEKIVIKINGNDEYSFEILNPLYKRLSYYNDTGYVEMYSLILLNFLEYCQIVDMKKYKVRADIKDEIYIELICQLFNDYIDNIKKDIDKWEINIPPFFMDEKFKINLDLLNNRKTIENLKSSKKIEYIFKVILGSYSKKRKKPVGVFNEQTVEIFNQFVDKLSEHIDRLLNINREYNLQKTDLLDFNDYFKLNYNIGSDKRLYPDIYNHFAGEETAGTEEKNKKNKKTNGMRKKPTAKNPNL